MSGQRHIPVMLTEVLESLAPKDGEVYVDGTFGGGGYTKAFLDSADCTVIAIDRDPVAIARAKDMQSDYGGRLIVVHGRFGDALELVRAAGFEQVDGFVLDVGVSSMQIDEASRGFSFMADGPLDMRMDPEQGPSAANIVNSYPESELADLIYQYGQERYSRKVAKKIVEARKEQEITTTDQLAEIVRSAVPKSKDGLDPATRSFQALRIAVNDEIGELKRALSAAEALLKTGGRLVVVSFHSLEDGEVKAFLYERSGKAGGMSRHMPEAEPSEISFELLHRKAQQASDEEVQANTRARSAKLRAATRVGGAS